MRWLRRGRHGVREGSGGGAGAGSGGSHLGAVHVVVQVCKGDLGLDHPKLGQVARRVGVFCAEGRAKGVDGAKGGRVVLGVELAGDSEEGRLAEKVLSVVDLPPERRGGGEVASRGVLGKGQPRPRSAPVQPHTSAVVCGGPRPPPSHYTQAYRAVRRAAARTDTPRSTACQVVWRHAAIRGG